MLADYFLSKISIKIDRLKVYELLMFHDVVYELFYKNIQYEVSYERNNKLIQKLKNIELK